ncbi:MAG: hypothetical protein ABJF11_08350 [Reichenbachiella sp.]|uniref:hypothetical protein n=1 Tax=Reichenbachiella sp. TaxID=2184521 RepID=UPI0032678F61
MKAEIIDVAGIEGIELDDTISLTEITTDFEIQGLNIIPTSVYLVYSDNQFSIYGEGTANFGDEQIVISLGSSASPAVEIIDGILTKVTFGMSENFDLKGINFSVQDLSFDWDGSNEIFRIYGNAEVSFETETIGVNLGTASFPGIELKKGALQKISAGITADFNLKALQFSPNDLSFGWDSQDDIIMFYGGATASFSGETVGLSFGDADSPGIMIENGVIQQISLGVTGDFTLSSLQFSPEDLTFAFDKSNNQFMMYGSGTFEIASEEVAFGMGDADTPGIVVEGSTLKSINLSLSKEFTLNQLSINPAPLGLQWDKSSNDFNIFGDFTLSISSQSISATLGDSQSPGMRISEGKLDYFNATINSDFQMGSLEVQAEDVNIEYSQSKYYFTGVVSVTQLWSASVDLGNDGGRGLEIDMSGSNNKFKINDFAIELSQIELGAVSLQNLRVGFANNTIESATAMVSFPPGYEVGATLEFEDSPAKLNNIGISFEATSFNTALPVGSTGMYIVYMEGNMKNLADPSTYVTVKDGAGHSHVTNGIYFEGAIAFTFGGPTTIGGKDAALLYNKNTAVVTKKFAVLSADLLLGAYRAGSNNWKSQLGEGSIVLDLIWNEYYSIKSSMKIPSDPLVTFDLNAKLSQNGSLNALMKVKLKVPKKIPAIGGKNIGGVNGAMRYYKNDLNGSYAAGWVTYKIGWKKKYAGARYNFGKKKVDIIGKNAVNNLKKEVSQALSSGRSSSTLDNEWQKNVYSFEVVGNATSLMLDVDFDQVVDETYVAVIGPDGFYDIHELIVNDLGDSEVPEVSLGEEKMVYLNTDKLNLYVINLEPENEESETTSSLLTPGQYDLLISYPSTNLVDSINLEMQSFFPSHFGDLVAEDLGESKYAINMTYWGHNPDSTEISVFWNDEPSYGGYHIGTLNYGDADESGFGEINLEFTAEDIKNESDMHFYFVMDDGDAVPFYSEITESFVYNSQISGQVSILEHNDNTEHSGIMLYVDKNNDGMYNTASTADDGEFETSIVTDEDGYFHFHGFEKSVEYKIGIVVPKGLELADGETKTQSLTYNGSPINLEFVLIETN